ncbi:MAG: NADH-quinone oxidoreductase subunit H [Candidatus Marsarchaeota archaeon]|jgi:NADH-quinone oxidoreductase subunit H|nr:NADH-quinone oxidoreductase subunit H [Candidatus Marsarchaeota archaeon]
MLNISSGFVGSYYTSIYNALAPLLGVSLILEYISLIVALIIFFIALFIIISLFGYIFGWLERKLIAKAQSRHGPTFLGKYGILQNLADFIKLISKEHIIPSNADKPIFQLSMVAIVTLFITALVFIPFTSTFVGVATSFSVLIVFFLLSLVPLIEFIIGWSSGNKFSSISAQRSVMMLASYEISILLVVASVILVAGSYNFQNIINAQTNMWFIVILPVGFFVFFIAMLGELERPPFDLREADSELIAGLLTDVSAPYYGLMLLVDYARMLLGSALIVILFFGGWLGPTFISAFIWFIAKVSIIALFIIIIRATTVRMRIDKLLRLGWKYLMPLAVINLLLAALILI